MGEGQVIHTYLQQHCQHSPMICLFAIPERGKSRTGRGMINVAYRGICVESLNPPYIFRLANDFGATIFFDVRDIWKKALAQGSDDILLLRFERGAKVARVLHPDKGAHKDIAYFDIFGPTVMGTNRPIDDILDTRAIQINMPKSSKVFDLDVTPELGLPLKERLLAFRALAFDGSMPSVQKPINSRLGDIIKPILQVVRFVRPEREPDLTLLIAEIDRDRKLEKSDGYEANLIRTIFGMRDQVQNGRLPVGEICDEFNHGKPERFWIRSSTVGRSLKSMGLSKKRSSGSSGRSALIWDDAKLEDLALSYGVEVPQKASESSESSESYSLSDGGGVVSEESEGSEGYRQPVQGASDE